jgi:hypothetical protein
MEHSRNTTALHYGSACNCSSALDSVSAEREELGLWSDGRSVSRTGQTIPLYLNIIIERERERERERGKRDQTLEWRSAHC